MGQTSTASSFGNSDIISTRGHHDYFTTELIPENNLTGYTYYDYATDNNSIRIQNEIICPPQKEVVIYIHGAWTDETSANEQFNRTTMSLAINNYTIPLIGFSWDSNTPFNEEGWKTAKTIAEKNGPKLAQFIFDFKNKCKNTDIRLIAHSLGAAVVNSTLITLYNNQEWNNNNDEFNITSVHLLGAAIDRSVTASNTTFGKAIEKVVLNFYNLRSQEDNMLEYAYRYVENQDALGLLGTQHSIPLPKNYFERQVDSEIPAIPDADGNNKLDCFDFFVILPGDNHCGYIGFRGFSPFEIIPRSDGAMDVVVQDWLENS
jgi:hypothetical protein